MDPLTALLAIIATVLAIGLALLFFHAQLLSESLEETQYRLGEEQAATRSLEKELAAIDHLLNVPALQQQKSRREKIAFSVATNRRAAHGQKVSNREADYQ